MERFQYKPMDLQGRSFRLVQLLKAEYGSVRCELFDAWLDDEEGGIEYEALSYTWGDTYKPHEIEINGRIMPVTKNLSLALRSLRYPHQDRILWIDAICIDQSNDRERGHQVLQMASIYKRAEQVVIWLGPATAETDLIFCHMSQVEKEAVKHVCKDWKVSDKRWLDMWQSVQPPLENGQTSLMSRQQQREGLKELLNRPWFDRVWIIQEVANARAAKVTCGTKSVSARIFALFPSLTGIKPSPHCQAILDVMPGPTRKHSWWSRNHDLHTLLLKFKGSEASDPRDKIYALLGISSDRFIPDSLKPDYEKSVGEVIQHTVAFLLRFHDGIVGTRRSPEWTLAQFLQSLELLGNEVCVWAAGDGSEAIVKFLLNTGTIDINFRNKYRQTSLLLSAEHGHEAIVKLLLNTGKVNINLLNDDGRSSLLLSAKHGHEAIVKLLLNTGRADINFRNENGETSLLQSAEHGHEAVVKLLLNTGKARINLQNKDGKTPLLLAAENGHHTVVKQLLDTGAADDTLGDSNGWIPLWKAAFHGYEAIVEMLFCYRLVEADESTPAQKAALEANKVIAETLLETYKADRKSKGSREGQVPLWWAVQHGHTTLVDSFLETGSLDIGTATKNGKELLVWLAHNKFETALRWLLNVLEVDLVDTRKDAWAWGLLIWASENGDDISIKLLLDTGRANVFFTGSRGQELISTAASRGWKAVVKLLIDSEKSNGLSKGEALWKAANHGHEPVVRLLLHEGGVDANFKFRNQQTPLWRAAWNGHTPIVKLLLGKLNIEVDSKDDIFEQTPLSMAAEHGHVAIVKLLLETKSVEAGSRDRDGQTPLALAMRKQHGVVAELLEMYIDSQ